MNIKNERTIISLIFFKLLVEPMMIIFLIRGSGLLSWASPSGVILLGPYLKRSEKIQQDGTTTYSFDLKHPVK